MFQERRVSCGEIASRLFTAQKALKAYSLLPKRKGGLRHPRKVEPQQLSSPGEGESSRAGTANGVLRNALCWNIILGLPLSIPSIPPELLCAGLSACDV